MYDHNGPVSTAHPYWLSITNQEQLKYQKAASDQGTSTGKAMAVVLIKDGKEEYFYSHGMAARHLNTTTSMIARAKYWGKTVKGYKVLATERHI